MRFSIPEHELLRLLALASPDWETVVSLASTRAMWGGPLTLDWPTAFRLGDAHQLGGVIRWRSLAPELDGLCLERVREDARAELARLEERRAAWISDLHTMLDPIEEAGIPYLYMGSPVGDARHGDTYWPRDFPKVGMDFPDRARGKVEAVRARLRRPSMSAHPRGGCDVSPSGLHRWQWDFLPNETWDAQATGARRVTLYGVEITTACDEVLVCRWVAKAHTPAVGQNPFTLESFARIADYARTVDLSACVAHLKEYAHMESWYRHPVPQELQEAWPAGMASAEARWGWHMTERVYPGTFPPAFLAEADALAANCWPPVYQDADRNGPKWPKVPLWTWRDLPDPEALLFDHYGETSIEQRVAAGFLREV